MRLSGGHEAHGRSHFGSVILGGGGGAGAVIAICNGSSISVLHFGVFSFFLLR